MLCPVCEAHCGSGESYCRRCGADLSIPNTTIVPVKPALPALADRPGRAVIPAPIKTGAGLVALGVGYELVRLGLRFWLRRPACRSLPALSAFPPFSHVLNLPGQTRGRRGKLRLLGRYQVTETIFYFHRVIGPRN